MKKGIGEVADVDIPECVWNDTILCSFLVTISKPGSHIKPLGTHARDMLRAMRSANESLFEVSESWRSPNGWAFVVPKNVKKCSWIFHLVELNGKMGGKPPSF